MKKHRKVLARARVDKKRINDEIVRLKKSGNIFGTMTMTEVKEHVQKEIKDVQPEDIYPKDLEKEFDKLERTHEVRMKKHAVSLEDDDDGVVHIRTRLEDDDGVVVGVGEDFGVMDMSDEEADADVPES